jgi:small conductance mechanosensitive channel
MDLIIMYGIKIVVSLLIFFVGKKLASWISSIFLKLMQRSNVDDTLSKFFSNIVYGLLIVVVVLATLSNLGINTTSFVAILGAAGLAIGLAFKDTFANIGAGVLIVFFRPFKIGNFIQASGEMGSVEEINLFSTILKTGDNKQIIIPNSSIIGGNITNFSTKDTRRVDFVFGIGYDDDLKLAKSTLEEIVSSDKRSLKEPAPFVAVSELADSSVNFVVRVWVKSEDYWGLYFDTIEKVKLTFDEKGISIPYPQMDIHTKN